MTPLFELGKVVATSGALRLLVETGTNPLDLLQRHVTGDWGNLNAEDHAENQFSIEHKFRIMSVYCLGAETLWIVTEADRSLSTLLLPSEY
jgi:hypothetical protein